MKRIVTVFAILVTVLTWSVTAGAHDEFRIIGALAKHANSTIEVKKRDGKTVSIRLDKQTAISRDKERVTPAELRAGQSLVIDAYGDTEDDSLAIEIRIVPPIRAGVQ
jgi:hypothetical protein